jgi:hypothetical protein
VRFAAKILLQNSQKSRGKLTVNDILPYRDFAASLPRLYHKFIATQDTFYRDIATCLPRIFHLLLPRVLLGILPRNSGLFLPVIIRMFAAPITAAIVATFPRQFQDVCHTVATQIARTLPLVFHDFAASLHHSYHELALVSREFAGSVFTARLLAICRDVAAYLPRACCKFVASLQHIYPDFIAHLSLGCCKFATRLL